jgi:regulator of protease activity HflC (stomatin/prohibitin superfamily)
VGPDEAGYRLSPRITGKNKLKTLTPGWYLWVPLFQKIVVIGIKSQPWDLRAQSVWTKDGYDIMISGVIKYRITDAVKACLEILDYDKSIQTVGLAVIHEYVSQHTLQECREGTADLVDKILSELRKESQGWGLKIQSVKLTDTGSVLNLRLLQNVDNESAE